MINTLALARMASKICCPASLVKAPTVNNLRQIANTCLIKGKVRRRWATSSARCAAGTQRTYANPSIGALGMITAASLGVPFASALEQQLFPALGMRNSFVQVPASKMAQYAQLGAVRRVQAGRRGGVLRGLASATSNFNSNCASI